VTPQPAASAPAASAAAAPPSGTPSSASRPDLQPRDDREAIRLVVNQHMREIQGCMEAGLRRDATLRGTIKVTAVIGAGGEVTSAMIQSSTIKDEGVSACIRTAIRSWRFPPRKRATEVVLPFVLGTVP